MRMLDRSQWIVLAACVASIVLLGFASTSPSNRKAPQVAQQPKGIPIEDVIKEERNSLQPDQSGVIGSLEQAIKSETDMIRRGMLYDSLVTYLGLNGKYVLASVYAEEKAKTTGGSGSDWSAAGERYRRAATFQEQMDHSEPLYKAAIRCFNKALELEPDNLDAKTGLGIAIVDGTNDPMAGITLLQEVEEADSTHIDMQLALAEFAMRSQQYDKAIDRFNKVLRMKPEMYAVHLSLAELYDVKKDTTMVIYHLEAYSAITDDPVMKAEIDKAVESLQRK